MGLVEADDVTCRICLAKTSSYSHIFDHNVKKNNGLPKHIHDIFGIQVLEDDDLPKTICNYCRERIHGICTFIRKTKNNQKHLLKKTRKKPAQVHSPHQETSASDEPTTEPTVDINVVQYYTSVECINDEPMSLSSNIAATIVSESAETLQPFPVEVTTKPVKAITSFSVVANNESDTVQPSTTKLDDVKVWETVTPSEDDTQWNECIDIWTDFYGMECVECHSCFYRFEKFMQHIVKKHQGKLVCTECHLSVKVTPSQLEYHIKYHTNPEQYKCKLCNCQEFDPIALEQHQSRVHGVKDLVCVACDMAFLKEAFLEEHIKECHSNSNKVCCPECGADFINQHALDCHMVARHNIYKGSKKICDVCGKAYYTVKGFIGHFKTHLKIDQPKLKCPMCNEELNDKAILKVHIRRRHSHHEPENCKECGKQCASRAALLRHVRYVHQPVVSYQCSICCKGYRKKYELIAHLSTHTGNPEFQCNYCTRRFNNHSNKFKHMKVKHTEEFVRDRKYKTIVKLPQKKAQ